MHYPYSLHFIPRKQKGTKYEEAVSPWDEPHLNRLALKASCLIGGGFQPFKDGLSQTS